MYWAAIYVGDLPFIYLSNPPYYSLPILINLRGLQEVRMRIGSKKIYHLEAWVVKVMSLYKVSPPLFAHRVGFLCPNRGSLGVTRLAYF